MKKDEPVGAVEEKIGHAMVKGRLINEAQLRTALDYQRSLGGTLTEIIAKLGFVKGPAVARFLAEANLAGGVSSTSQVKLAPVEIGLLKSMSERSPPAAAAPARKDPPEEADRASELTTQRPTPKGAASEAAQDSIDPVLRDLIHLLQKKGVIAPKEEEKLLRRARAPA
jgi:hypothetical protein